MRSEDILTNQISQYLQLQYPKILFHFDTGQGAVKSIGMAMRDKRINPHRGYPDLIICKSMNGWHGLFIELKTKSPFKKDGNIKSDKHLEEQLAFHSRLTAEGYMACFAVGFDQCVEIIKNYLKGLF